MNILCYHAVQNGWDAPVAIVPEEFEEHCSWLARSASIMPLAGAVTMLQGWKKLPHRTTAITFDDGYESVYTSAFPILKRYKLRATVFVIAETLTPQGRAIDWVDIPPPSPTRTLSLDQILEMQDAGIEFASHSMSHFDLTALSDDECERDLRESRELLESLLGHPVPFLAYPRGWHNERVRNATARAGYTHAFTLPESHEPLGPFSIPRVGIYPGNHARGLAIKAHPMYLAMRMNPAYPALRKLGQRVS